MGVAALQPAQIGLAGGIRKAVQFFALGGFTQGPGGEGATPIAVFCTKPIERDLCRLRCGYPDSRGAEFELTPRSTPP